MPSCSGPVLAASRLRYLNTKGRPFGPLLTGAAYLLARVDFFAVVASPNGPELAGMNSWRYTKKPSTSIGRRRVWNVQCWRQSHRNVAGHAGVAADVGF